MDADAVLKKKWKVVKPKGSNGYYYVLSGDFKCICNNDKINKHCVCGTGDNALTVYGQPGRKIARHIVKLHNNYIDNLKKE